MDRIYTNDCRGVSLFALCHAFFYPNVQARHIISTMFVLRDYRMWEGKRFLHDIIAGREKQGEDLCQGAKKHVEYVT